MRISTLCIGKLPGNQRHLLYGLPNSEEAVADVFRTQIRICACRNYYENSYERDKRCAQGTRYGFHRYGYSLDFGYETIVATLFADLSERLERERAAYVARRPLLLKEINDLIIGSALFALFGNSGQEICVSHRPSHYSSSWRTVSNY